MSTDGSTYRERREARAERLRGWADKREERAEGAHRRAHEIAQVIPLGQPILVGHHSERRHRRDLARIESSTRKGFEDAAKADSMRQRANSIDAQLERSIYDDDPDAIEALEERIATLEAQRDRVKRYNASCRKGQRDLSILDDSQREKLESIARYAAFQLGDKGEFPSYHLSNLSGNINRNKKRLAELRSRKGAE